MENQQTQDARRSEAVELPIDLVSGTKGFWGDLSRQQIIKLAVLGLGLIVWYPVATASSSPSPIWVAYDLFRIPHGTPPGGCGLLFLPGYPQGVHAPGAGGLRGGHPALLFYPGADPGHPGGQAGDSGRCSWRRGWGW